MSNETDLAAGIVVASGEGAGRRELISSAAGALDEAFTPTSVWQAAVLPPDLRGGAAFGEDLPVWVPVDAITADERAALTVAWTNAMPELGDHRQADFLRVRVGGPEDLRALRKLGEVDGVTIVPSLDSRGRMRSFEWRWPLHVGVVPGAPGEWLDQIRDTPHHGMVFDAEVCDPAGDYEIAVVSAADLATMSDELADRLGEVPCVIVAGDEPAEELLWRLESRIEPAIAVAFRGWPGEWWYPLFEEMSHDLPVDVAVERVVSRTGIDALMAGPRRGLDITASAHWFAAVAPEIPDLEAGLGGPRAWFWDSEGGGTTNGVEIVRAARGRGLDPVAVVEGPTRGAIGEAVPEEAREQQDPRELALEDAAAEEPERAARRSPPRRLVARVIDGEEVVKSILPPQRDLMLAVRIAIPVDGDVAADEASPALPPGTGPTIELDVVVRSDIWAEQPKPQPISLSRDKATLPSTWARFRFTTPAEGSLVSIEIVLLYQGKPLQAATYVSPVGAGLPGETPTLTTFALSGPDEPTDDLRPVDASLDGRKADLAHTDGRGGTVTIADVQQKLNAIEDRVSKVLGVPGAPDSFDDARAFELLVTLARIGTQLRLLLGPLELDDSSSINVRVNPETPVLPLELVYSGPAPREKGAKLCRHVDEPPALGEGCDLASTTIVCPYAFWGLSRSISRTIESTPTKRSRPWTQPSSPFSVLYASTDIADDGATAPTPSETVLASAKTSFQPVTRVTSWTAWRKAVRTSKPNLLVVLGHTLVEGGETRLYIGRKSSISRVDISAELLRADDSAPPLVLLIACATAVLGDVFGTLPGSLTANGAGAVVGTLSKIVGPQGAEATVHLLDSLHGAAPGATVGDAVAGARHTLVAQKRPIGLLLVSHGEMDTKAVP